MEKHSVDIEAVMDYIEAHLDEKLDLEKASEAVHYSKYYLHRMFTNTVKRAIELIKESGAPCDMEKHEYDWGIEYKITVKTAE